MTPYAASEPVERPRVDAWLSAAESALRTVGGVATATRPQPVPSAGSAGLSDGPSGASVLTEDERRLSGALMRVNHVGEVCAQALYQAQALTARTPALRQRMRHAAKEEIDHLAWTQARLDALGAHPSRLNPLWYAGSFAIGMAAGLLGDRVSLGFVVETEDQVERHLGEHLDRLPPRDVESRVIVEQMQADESKHAAAARDAGAVALPWPVKMAMKLAAKVMTSTAHRV